ncbi:hypothetical protein [Natronorubrum sp. FCH18a]|uniref:hypothetical protein n=1 Tax=Natronorubrum sp. FCH18a TaxID=3447018 RepID=UPI003F51A62C
MQFRWTSYVRLYGVFAFFLAMVFVGPLAAIIGLAIVLVLLPDPPADEAETTASSS